MSTFNTLFKVLCQHSISIIELFNCVVLELIVYLICNHFAQNCRFIAWKNKSSISTSYVERNSRVRYSIQYFLKFALFASSDNAIMVERTTKRYVEFYTIHCLFCVAATVTWFWVPTSHIDIVWCTGWGLYNACVGRRWCVRCFDICSVPFDSDAHWWICIVLCARLCVCVWWRAW